MFISGSILVKYLLSHSNDIPKSCKIINSCYSSRRGLCNTRKIIDHIFNLKYKSRNTALQASSKYNMMAFTYPEARRDDAVVDVLHGTEIRDPYRWLEDPDSEETKAYVDAQNAVTRPYLEESPVRADIKNRLTELWNYPKYSCPYKRGDKYFFLKNTGLQNQSVLYIQDTLDGEPRIFLDPNTFSEDGTVAVSSSSFSEDGSLYAYALSASGSDWITIHIKDVTTGTEYPEVIKRAKFTKISWTKDNKGFFYGRFNQEGKTDGSETLSNENQKLYYHRIGTSQDEDVLVVEFPEEPFWRFGAEVSDCGRYLILSVMKECRDSLVFFADLKANGEIADKLSLQQIVFKMEADYDYVTNDDSVHIFRTNKDAPNYRLIKIDFNNPAMENWTTLLAEDPKDVLDWAACVNNNQLTCCYLQDVKNVLQLRSLNTGELLTTFPIDVGTIQSLSGKRNQTEIFYQFTSFLTPGVIYHCDLSKTDFKPTVFREVKVEGFDATQYTSDQVFYTSKDGTKVPMFIVTKKDYTRDGSRPCLLYGYGGFNISVQPGFSVSRLVFMQHFDGVLAVPNIRGGGEYGEKWHNAGRWMNKQNVFDDFQAAAEYLVKEGYTTQRKLTIQGGSNGGLLVGACINQRPDLFGAAIIQVGVLDMLRYHKFTIGVAWGSDYGVADEKEHFENLIKYSPLHNVQSPQSEDKQYPATLIMTADHDDRVVPLHSLKFVAALHDKLRGSSFQKNPILIRIDTKAGHGAGKPTAKLIEEAADMLTFVARSLNLTFRK